MGPLNWFKKKKIETCINPCNQHLKLNYWIWTETWFGWSDTGFNVNSLLALCPVFPTCNIFFFCFPTSCKILHHVHPQAAKFACLPFGTEQVAYSEIFFFRRTPRGDSKITWERFSLTWELIGLLMTVWVRKGCAWLISSVQLLIWNSGCLYQSFPWAVSKWHWQRACSIYFMPFCLSDWILRLEFTCLQTCP